MDLSFKEKSIIGSLIATAIVFSYYFSQVFSVLRTDSLTDMSALPMTLIGVVVVMIIIEVAYQSLIALTSTPEKDDERDRLIEAKATRVAYFVLAAGCITAIGHATLVGYVGGAGPAAGHPIMTANLVLFAFIAAEMTGFGMQLYFYRRGV